MRLVDRYLLRELTLPLFYCLLGFLIFWVSFDLFSELAHFQRIGLGAREIGAYYLIKSPELLALVMPIALLLALLYTLSNHARHNEIVAMRSAGLNLWRISLPYFAVGAVFSFILLALNEKVVPQGGQKIEALLRRGAADPEAKLRRNIYFRDARTGRIWNIARFNPETFEMTDPQIEWSSPDGANHRLLAKSATRENGVWIFHEAQELTYKSGQEFDVERVLAKRAPKPEFAETPDQIEIQIKFNKLSSIAAAKRPHLSLAEIIYLRSHLLLSSKDRALLDTQWHARLAAPWTCLVVVLIALPFGAVSGRRNVVLGVASSIIICFAFFLLSRLGLALGTGGYLPGWLAAWLPNALFALFGAVLTQRMV